jgi:cytochrome c peroxidase
LQIAATGTLAIFLLEPCAAQSLDKRSFLLPAEVPMPATNAQTPERIELGRMLFFDPRLSNSKHMSCATCHNPAYGWFDRLALARGENMRDLQRATLRITNSGYDSLLMWDGSAHSLEEQAWRPILATNEMHSSDAQVLDLLQSLPGYLAAFEKAYSREGITHETVAKALACFERSIVSRDSPFDRWAAGDDSAIEESAKRGFGIFVGKANCAGCHFGGNFTDQGFHNTGLQGNGDEGRYAVVRVPILHGAFKTPTLRDVAISGPYMHNGAYRTLEEVVEHYNRGGDVKEHLDPNMKPLFLTDLEKKDLVEFLKSLTGNQRVIGAPKLP